MHPETMLRGSYYLTRVLYLRLLGLIYATAFAVALFQNEALLGAQGLTPFRQELSRMRSSVGGGGVGAAERFQRFPTLLWFMEGAGEPEDNLRLIEGAGLVLSLQLLLFGSATAPLMATLWLLYHSIVTVGGRWYGFGWESQLLEVGFLSIWLCPLASLDRFPRHFATPHLVVFGSRWLLFRIMLGAGLIKIRGDACWRDLTCMHYHYETQPVPGPLSWHLHHLPGWWHMAEVCANHVVELVLPWLLLGGRSAVVFCGLCQVVFQVVLILSGNLSFLNWLTILPALFCLDDHCLQPFFSRSDVKRVQGIVGGACNGNTERRGAPCRWFTSVARSAVHMMVLVLLAKGSIPVVHNLFFSRRQAMNTSFDTWKIVNTYGAFGSITKERTEVVLQGTLSDDPMGAPASEWQDFEFKCKPTDPTRPSCLITPYHYRLDWLMWFAAFQSYQHNPWLVHLGVKLTQGDRGVRSLLAPGGDPFETSTRGSARFVRAEHYRYVFTTPAERAATGRLWTRTRLGEYMPPISLENTSVQKFLRQHGWL